MKVNIFWFKRDLRLHDNDALHAALQSNNPILLIYVYEPSLLVHNHYSKRHWRFVEESLDDLDENLKNYNISILRITNEILPLFHTLRNIIDIDTVYSTEESGLDITYQRDIGFAEFCKENRIHWLEFQNGGVQRGLKNRDSWRNGWYNYMNRKIKTIRLEDANFMDFKSNDDLAGMQSKKFNYSENHVMQKGGRSEGIVWKDSFFNERLQYYSTYISKPEMSRYGCSRLSPYFAWGCISIREIYQQVQELRRTSPYKKQLSAFSARLRWQAHFIQKFEMEPRIEFEPFNKGYLQLEQPLVPHFVEAWKAGKTGFPLVDASMRAVVQTGYLNFRMRTMCTSFLLHHLFQNFRTGSAFLARQFLDFEPGIHYGQFQMQAGFTATNTLRIYNPTKNAIEHDPEAVFIKKYVPELAHLPAKLAIEPWSLTDMEEKLYNFRVGKDYPERIVDIKETRKIAMEKLYGMRKLQITKDEKQRILDVHTLKRNYKN